MDAQATRAMFAPGPAEEQLQSFQLFAVKPVSECQGNPVSLTRQ